MGNETETPQEACEKPWRPAADLVALALHRLYGLPMLAEHAVGMHGRRTVRGCLTRAWAILPDGRAIDADGLHPEIEPTPGGDPDDPWVLGHVVVGMPDRAHGPAGDAALDPAVEWVLREMGPLLSDLGLRPRPLNRAGGFGLTIGSSLPMPGGMRFEIARP